MSAPACAHAHCVVGPLLDDVIEGRSGRLEGLRTVPTMPVCQQVEAVLAGDQPAPGTTTHETTT